jgi:hypothetical protein
MIHGTPIYHTVDDRTDFIGIRTLVLQKMWQPSRGGISQVELDDEVPPPPAVPGGLLLVGTQTRRSSGVFYTTWTYEGVNGNGQTVTFKDREHSLDSGFTPSMSQAALALSPDFPRLRELYDGFPDVDGRIFWPPFISGKSSSGLGGGSSKEEVNPMFGQEDYYVMAGVYRHRYAEKTLPSGLFDGVGRVEQGALPGTPPRFPSRDWLKAAPQFARRGLIWEIIEYYWLSREGGWPPQYRRDLGKGGGNPGTDLITGTLITGSL